MKRIALVVSLAAAAAVPAQAQTLNTGNVLNAAGQVLGTRISADGQIFTRRRVDANGNVTIERSRRDANGNYVIFDTQVIQRSNTDWRLNGRDNNRVYVRRRVDANGNIVIERARRDANGNFVIFDNMIVRRGQSGDSEWKRDSDRDTDRDTDRKMKKNKRDKDTDGKWKKDKRNKGRGMAGMVDSKHGNGKSGKGHDKGKH